jgi:hypothetical protein
MIGAQSASNLSKRAMSVGTKTVLEYLGQQHQPMVALLAELVNIDSGSYHKPGVDAVGGRMRLISKLLTSFARPSTNATYGD